MNEYFTGDYHKQNLPVMSPFLSKIHKIHLSLVNYTALNYEYICPNELCSNIV